MGNVLALVNAKHNPKIEPLLSQSSVNQERETEKIPLTFSSLTFLFFWSLFLNYLFLLVYLIIELVAYFYGHSLLHEAPNIP